MLWSEVHSAIHEAGWRGEIDTTRAESMFGQFDSLEVKRKRPIRVYPTAIEIADELGWARTYDAEFLALARIENAVVLTTDARLRRGADRTGLAWSSTRQSFRGLIQPD